ncbi:MAG: hypothetical protein ACT4O1_14190 [Gemmatimonadota bacterium]
MAPKYYAIASALLRTARDLNTLGELKYGNGLAIVTIHAAIAYCDALCIAYREIKSSDGDHGRAVDALAHALGARAYEKQLDRLAAILDAKTHASYSGNYYTLEEARLLLKQTELFAAWAEGLYNNRPA